MTTTATLTPTRRPGLRAAVDRIADRIAVRLAGFLHGTLRHGGPAPVAGAVALLAACAAGVLVVLGAPADEMSAALSAAAGG